MTFLAADTRIAKPVDPGLTRILSHYAEMLAAASRPAPDWRERFEQALALAIADGSPSLAEIANRLVVTPRTLQRRLTDHGTTWQHELDRARDAHAAALKATGMPMAAIASRLGYSNPRSLRRAMHRWAAAAAATATAESDRRDVPSSERRRTARSTFPAP